MDVVMAHASMYWLTTPSIPITHQVAFDLVPGANQGLGLATAQQLVTTT